MACGDSHDMALWYGLSCQPLGQSSISAFLDGHRWRPFDLAFLFSLLRQPSNSSFCVGLSRWGALCCSGPKKETMNTVPYVDQSYNKTIKLITRCRCNFFKWHKYMNNYWHTNAQTVMRHLHKTLLWKIIFLPNMRKINLTNAQTVMQYLQKNLVWKVIFLPNMRKINLTNAPTVMRYLQKRVLWKIIFLQNMRKINHTNAKTVMQYLQKMYFERSYFFQTHSVRFGGFLSKKYFSFKKQ